MKGDIRDRLQGVLGPGFAVERELGGGGMSRVFVAEEIALGRRIVVKVLPPELAEGLSAERFAREMQLAARLQHPHIVPLLSTGAGAGLVYYTMPFVEGESLAVRIDRDGQLPIDVATRIARETAQALHYAHEQGVTSSRRTSCSPTATPWSPTSASRAPSGRRRATRSPPRGSASARRRT